MVFPTHSRGWLGECCRWVRVVVFLLLSFTPVSLSANSEIPVLTTDSTLATAGYYQLSWQPGLTGASNKKHIYQLQQSHHSNFSQAKTLYRGPDLASVISGQMDGVYYYRVRYSDHNGIISPWSATQAVQVQHHTLSRALLFFIAGALVFLGLLIFILTGARRQGSLAP